MNQLQLPQRRKGVTYLAQRNRYILRRKVEGKYKRVATFKNLFEANAASLSFGGTFGGASYIYYGGIPNPELGREGRDETPKGEVSNLDSLPKTIEVRVCREVFDKIDQSTFSPQVKDQAIYFASLLLLDGSPRRLDSQILNHLLRSYKKVSRFLIPKYVARGSSYSNRSNVSKEYRYATTPKETITATLTNETLIGKLIMHKKDKHQRQIKFLDKQQGFSSEGVSWIIESLDNFTLSWAGEELAARKDVNIDELRTRRISCTNGRLWHGLTQLPSEVRLNGLLRGESVADVDMSKSQLAILSAAFMKDEEEKRRFQELILGGTIYSRMGLAMELDAENITKWNKNPKNKKDQITTTKEFLNKCLMGHQGNDWHGTRQLKREFPIAMKSIISYKWKCDVGGGEKRGTQMFAGKLHGVEGSIIADVATKCMQIDIPCVSIFDGMLVPRSQADLVQGFFTEVLTKRLGFAPEPSVETAGYETFDGMCAGF